MQKVLSMILASADGNGNGGVFASIAVICTVLGGLLTKYGDKLLFARQKAQQLEADVAEEIRAELRIEIREIKEELQEQRDDLDKWRDRYFKLRHAYNNVKGKCKLLHLEVLVTRGDIKAEDLHRYIPGTNKTAAEDKVDAALDFEDGFLDAIDAEVERDDEAKRRRAKVKRAAATVSDKVKNAANRAATRLATEAQRVVKEDENND